MFKSISITLVTQNLNKLLKFYHETLKLNLVLNIEDNAIFSLGGTDLHIHQEQNEKSHHVASDNNENKGAFIVNFESNKKIPALKDTLEALNVKIRSDIISDPSGTVDMLFFEDPDGNELCAFNRK